MMRNGTQFHGIRRILHCRICQNSTQDLGIPCLTVQNNSAFEKLHYIQVPSCTGTFMDRYSTFIDRYFYGQVSSETCTFMDRYIYRQVRSCTVQCNRDKNTALFLIWNSASSNKSTFRCFPKNSTKFCRN